MRSQIDGTHADHILTVVGDGLAPAQSIVAASWRRSLTFYGLDPNEQRSPEMLTELQLCEACQEIEPLTRVAQSTLDRLFLAVGDAGCCVLLASRDGVPVDRRGVAADDKTFRRWGLWMGAVWSEAHQGTNGIGTCLAEGRALTIHRDQHFHTRNIGLSCTVAPIYDHLGRLAAALDVSSFRGDLTDGLTNLIAAAVASAARSIEVQNFRQAFPDARIVLASDAEKGASALLAVDRHDLVIGATRSARLSLNITDDRISGHLPAIDVLASSSSQGADLHDAERGVLRRVLAQAGGNVSAAARALGISRATLHRKLNRLGVAAPH